LKKWVPTTWLGRCVATEISVTDRAGRVGRENRRRLADPIELGEDALFQVELLGHRLHDEVDVVQRRQPEREPSRDRAMRRARPR